MSDAGQQQIPNPAYREPSCSQAFDFSMEWMKRLLFPFDFGRWIMFAFCAWLAALGAGGVNPFMNFSSGFPSPPAGGGTDSAAELQKAADWFTSNLGIIILIGSVIVVASLALGLLLQWLHARGTFMLLDAVITGDPKIGDSWSATRMQGNSLFLFHAIVMVAWMTLSLIVLLIFSPFVLHLMKSGKDFGAFFSSILWGIVPLALLLVILSVIWSIINLFINDFVVPIMYRRGLTFVPAAKIYWNLFRSSLGRFAFYLLVRIGIAIGIGFLSVIVIYLTCCLSCGILALPVLVMLPVLPFIIFTRSFSLFYIEQFGPEWTIFPRDPVPDPAPLTVPFQGV